MFFPETILSGRRECSRFNEREFTVRSIKLLHELDSIGGGIYNKNATYFGLCRW